MARVPSQTLRNRKQLKQPLSGTCFRLEDTIVMLRVRRRLSGSRLNGCYGNERRDLLTTGASMRCHDGEWGSESCSSRNFPMNGRYASRGARAPLHQPEAEVVLDTLLAPRLPIAQWCSSVLV
ncbi:hypothetical protein LSAT2_015012 [Lamellibrachia satsuma]|nr:hypothetical protein LSAT2_015012 [Lamellibrachia satsuma]